jgi:hypothetical protein
VRDRGLPNDSQLPTPTSRPSGRTDGQTNNNYRTVSSSLINYQDTHAIVDMIPILPPPPFVLLDSYSLTLLV